MMNKVEQLKLENTIRTVAKEIFDIMIGQEKINFQFIQHNQVKFIGIEERLINTQSQCDSLQKRFDDKFTSASLLISEMSQFKKTAETNLLSLTNSIFQLENNLQVVSDSNRQRESLVTQTFSTVKRIQNQMVSVRSDVKLNRQFVTKRLGEDVHKIIQEVSEVRTTLNSLEIQFQRTKAGMEAKDKELSQIVGAIKAYQTNDQEVQIKLKLMFDQLEVRPLQIELAQIRRSVDHKFRTQSELTKSALTKLSSEINSSSQQHDLIVQRLNCSELDIQSKLSKLAGDMTNSVDKINKCLPIVESLSNQAKKDGQTIKTVSSEIDHLFSDLEAVKQKQQELLDLDSRLDDLEEKMDQISKHNSDLMSLTYKIENIQDQQTRLTESQGRAREKSGTVGAVETVGTVGTIGTIGAVQPSQTKQAEQPKQFEAPLVVQVKQTQKQKKRRPSRNYRIRPSESQIQVPQPKEDPLKKYDEQFQKVKSSLQQAGMSIKSIQDSIQQLSTGNQQTALQTQQLYALTRQTDIRLSMVQKAVLQCQSVTRDINQRIVSLSTVTSKIDNVGGILEDIETRVKQAQRLSEAMATRTQEINNLLVKTRSDITIKSENTLKQILKVSNQLRSLEKTSGCFASTLPVLCEIIFMILAKQLNESENPKKGSYAGRFSSTLEGVVFSLDDKVLDPHVITYRGESVQTISLFSRALHYLISFLDSTRNTYKTTFTQGKEIYRLIVPKPENLTQGTTKFVRSNSRNRKSIL